MSGVEQGVRAHARERAFAHLFEMAIDLLAIADADGRYTFLNDAWERTLGWRREELIGVSFLEFVHPDDHEATRAVMARTADAGFELEDFENRYRCRDGSYRWLSWRASTDGDRWYAIAREVSERKAQDARQLGVMSRMRGMIVDRTREMRSAAGALEIAETEIVRRLSMAVEWRDDETGLHVERAIMQTHAVRGYELLRASASPILELAATIAWTHHEKFDGSGYPRGLAGDEIPIEGRIVAIVDVFDALTSDRVYRPAFAYEEALAMMAADRGTHFDPRLLDVFLDVAGDMTHPPRRHLRNDRDT